MPHLFSIDPVSRGMTAEGIVSLCDEAISNASTIQSSLRGMKEASDEHLTKDTVIRAFDELTYSLQLAGAFASLMSLAHPEIGVRDAAKTCEPMIDAFVTALYLDQDLFDVLIRYDAKKDDALTGPEKRLLEFTLRDFRRNGLQLDEAKKERLRELNKELTELGQQFESNIADDTKAIEIRPDQLDGLPETYRRTHQQHNGFIRISTDYPDIVPYMKYAKDRSAAKELFILNNTRAKEKNLPILDKLIALRDKKAKLLGYATWADLVLEPRMAKTASNVRAFIDDLHAELHSTVKKEYEVLHAIYEQNGGTEERIPISDAGYVHELAAKKIFAFDSQALSEYFELNAVKAGVLEIATRLYDIRFIPKTDQRVWHADVETYDVTSASGQIIGRFFLDLFPREGKYKHMAVFGIRETCVLPDGTRQIPLCAMVGNFPQPGTEPSLLSHDDVTTFFHEFGHLLHHLLSDSPFASFAGTNVARDFVEAPSQLFEEWAWSRETLDVFARQYRTGERIPDDLFNAMITERSFGKAIFTERQLQLADLDLTYHTRTPGFDTSAVTKEMQERYSPFKIVEGTAFQATFGHLVGYDAGYYGYQWSLAIAYDLMSRFRKEGIMNAETASEYRKMILSQGGCKDASMLVQDFLGRPSNADAYKTFLGVRE